MEATRHAANNWVDRFQVMVDRCVEHAGCLPESQTIHVQFSEFMANDMDTIARIYELAGHPLTPDISDAMTAYIAANPRGKHGRIVYDLRGDFAVEPAALRKRFDFYFQQFPVKTEVK